MRVRFILTAALLVVLAHTASADPITAPGKPWLDGQGRAFQLLWNNESQATFSVDHVGTSVYTSLDACCSDVFDRVRTINPGSSLTFSKLVLNWGYRIDTVIQDDLDWNLLKANGFDNLISLTGVVTLNLAPGARRGAPRLAFNAPYEEPVSAAAASSPNNIPEPGVLLLVGSGLLGFATMARRRMARSANPVAEPAKR